MSGWVVAAGLALVGLAVFAAFWFRGGAILQQLVVILANAAWDTLKADRMSPEDEAAWRDCQRRGGRWDAEKKRCVDPR